MEKKNCQRTVEKIPIYYRLEASQPLVMKAMVVILFLIGMIDASAQNTETDQLVARLRDSPLHARADAIPQAQFKDVVEQLRQYADGYDPKSKGQLVSGPDLYAVSYTHLTLPTICSV